MAGKDTTVIAGKGWVFTGAPDTEALNLGAFNPDSPSEGWTWLGSTSKENPISLEMSGGDVTVLDTWDTPGMRSNKSTTAWTMTIAALSMSKDMFEHAFPGGKWDEGEQTYEVPNSDKTVDKAVMIVMEDPQRGYLGLYFSKGSVSIAGTPKIMTDNFMEVPIQVKVLAGKKNRMKWFLPKGAKGPDSRDVPGLGG